MVNRLYQDIAQQPRAIRDLIAFYATGTGAVRLASLPTRAAPLITGMGASFHAAQAIVPYFSSLHIPAVAVEATELLYYGRALLHDRTGLVFVSQSGASAEVAAILEELPAGHTLLAVTNDPQSPLARHAQVVLPILAGEERGVATKTYLNSLATLWLLARRWCGAWSGDETQTLLRVADACEQLLAESDQIAARWLDTLGDARPIVFAGHGPHAATARQAAMMLAERARVAAIGTSVGAFRHGPIEIVQPGVGVVIFTAPGRAGDSAHALAAELHEYGARVLLVENGRTRGVGEPGDSTAVADEYLSPMLDVIPAQLFADALARQLDVAPGFRYISKVVTQL
jgi:glucosamine--fructose-6-phosphate aminotransferase (isomerizing)